MNQQDKDKLNKRLDNVRKTLQGLLAELGPIAELGNVRTELAAANAYVESAQSHLEPVTDESFTDRKASG